MIPVYCPRCGTELGERRLEGRDRKWCPACEKPVYRNAVPSADVAVVDGDRVLLVKRGEPPGEGAWTIPGGHLEFEEEPRAGATRELEEETGVSVESDVLALLEVTQLEPYEDKHVVSTAYATDVDATEGTPEADSDAAAVRWVTREEAIDLDTRPHVERRMTAAIQAVEERRTGENE